MKSSHFDEADAHLFPSSVEPSIPPLPWGTSPKGGSLIFLLQETPMETIAPPIPVLQTEFNARDQEDLSIQKAISILEERMFKRGPHLTMPLDVQNYLRLQLAGEIREVFSCIFLDSSHRILAYEPLFFGTIDTTSAHPRIILQRALEHNSSAVILAHNHPSGVVTPSESDISLTKHLRMILSHVDVRLLDHFIIGQGEPYSFATAGLL